MGDIKELKITYEESIFVQKEVIAKNREKLKRAEKNNDFAEMRRLRYLLNILYDEKCELEYLYNCLKDYA